MRSIENLLPCPRAPKVKEAALASLTASFDSEILKALGVVNEELAIKYILKNIDNVIENEHIFTIIDMQYFSKVGRYAYDTQEQNPENSRQFVKLHEAASSRGIDLLDIFSNIENEPTSGLSLKLNSEEGSNSFSESSTSAMEDEEHPPISSREEPVPLPLDPESMAAILQDELYVNVLLDDQQ
jgi:hypothetical protein